jgi:hypothetical protein
MPTTVVRLRMRARFCSTRGAKWSGAKWDGAKWDGAKCPGTMRFVYESCPAA